MRNPHPRGVTRSCFQQNHGHSLIAAASVFDNLAQGMSDGSLLLDATIYSRNSIMAQKSGCALCVLPHIAIASSVVLPIFNVRGCRSRSATGRFTLMGPGVAKPPPTAEGRNIGQPERQVPGLWAHDPGQRRDPRGPSNRGGALSEGHPTQEPPRRRRRLLPAPVQSLMTKEFLQCGPSARLGVESR